MNTRNYLEKYWNFVKTCWNTNIGQGKYPNLKKIVALLMILGLFVIAVCIFGCYAIIGMITLRFAFLQYLSKNPDFQINDITWMAYGLILGIVFSMFLESIPKRHGELESPKEIFDSLFHQFGYFLCILTALLIWIIFLKLLGIL
jgi:hypothetical protein